MPKVNGIEGRRLIQIFLGPHASLCGSDTAGMVLQLLRSSEDLETRALHLKPVKELELQTLRQ